MCPIASKIKMQGLFSTWEQWMFAVLQDSDLVACFSLKRSNVMLLFTDEFEQYSVNHSLYLMSPE